MKTLATSCQCHPFPTGFCETYPTKKPPDMSRWFGCVLNASKSLPRHEGHDPAHVHGEAHVFNRRQCGDDRGEFLGVVVDPVRRLDAARVFDDAFVELAEI